MMQYTMSLSPRQKDLLEGKEGETMAKIMETLIRYGELFGADSMAEVTGPYNHLVTSFGLKAMGAVYELMDRLIEAGALSRQKFTVDPRPLDPNVPCNFLENFVFKHFMYSRQDDYEKQLKKLGILNDEAYTCTSYMPEVGNEPKAGDILSWSESSAVVYANSVLGARCNRNSGILDLMGSIAGFVPRFGLLTDEGRQADWVVEIHTSKLPEAQLLGSAVGMKVLEKVPYIRGLEGWLGTELNEKTKSYLKDFGAATASNGAVGLYHAEGLTPEARQKGSALIRPDARTYVVDDAELERVYASYPVLWKKKDAAPQLCFMGCPHMSLEQLQSWTARLETALRQNQRAKVAVPTVFTAAPQVLRAFRQSGEAQKLKSFGVILSSICPLMYMNNPLCAKKRVITSSNKLRTYTSARYYTDGEILAQLAGGQHENI